MTVPGRKPAHAALLSVPQRPNLIEPCNLAAAACTGVLATRRDCLIGTRLVCAAVVDQLLGG